MKKAILFFVIIVFLIIAAHDVFSDETIMVQCYVERPSAFNELGNVEVGNPESAAQSCNNVYYDCKGRCIGCYLHQDGYEICIDAMGNEFLK
jgi:hypothetical protein